MNNLGLIKKKKSQIIILHKKTLSFATKILQNGIYHIFMASLPALLTLCPYIGNNEVQNQQMIELPSVTSVSSQNDHLC